MALIAAAVLFVIGFPAAMLAFVDWDDWRDDMRGHMYGGSDTSGEAPRAGGLAETVGIRDFAFRPGNLRLPAGATVTWTNAADAPHTATDGGGRWATGRLDEGESESITFVEPGDYTYICEYHPDMKARLVVG